MAIGCLQQPADILVCAATKNVRVVMQTLRDGVAVSVQADMR
jgi:hypothetical protein